MKKLDKIILLVTIAMVLITYAFLCGFDSNQKKQLSITKFDKPIESIHLDNLNYNIESIKLTNNIFSIVGWAYVKGTSSVDVIPCIILKDDNNNLYKVKTRITKRTDVTRKINDGKNYNNSGFLAQFSIAGLEKGKKYKIGIQMEINKTVYFKWTDKQITL